MKYLKLFEELFIDKYDRPSKGRSSEISKEEAIKILKENCGEFLKNPKAKVYRGLGDNDSDYLLIKPSEHSRRSANTKNIYTLFMDNSYRWKGYPKRSKSIICSTNEGIASDYGFHFVVVPFDGAKFGVCPMDDIWFSFHTHGNINSMDSFCYSLTDSGISDKDYDLMVKSMDELQKKMVEGMTVGTKKKFFDKLGKIYNPDNLLPEYKDVYLKDKTTLYDYIDDLLDPVKNGFRILSHNDITKNDDCEVWTDSNCLLFSPKALHEILKEIK